MLFQVQLGSLEDDLRDVKMERKSRQGKASYT